MGLPSKGASAHFALQWILGGCSTLACCYIPHAASSLQCTGCNSKLPTVSVATLKQYPFIVSPSMTPVGAAYS